MTVKVSKPAINIREKLSELDISTVPYHKMPAGSILQVEQTVLQVKLSLTNATAKWGEVSLNTKAANSKFLVEVDVGMGFAANSSNNDVDVAIAVGYKSGAVDAASQNYEKVSSSSFAREVITGLHNWLTWDAYISAGTYEGYMFRHYAYRKIFSPQLPAGSDLNIAQFVQTSNGTISFGSGQTTAYSDSGFEQSITITEIAQ